MGAIDVPSRSPSFCRLTTALHAVAPRGSHFPASLERPEARPALNLSFLLARSSLLAQSRRPAFPVNHAVRIPGGSPYTDDALVYVSLPPTLWDPDRTAAPEACGPQNADKLVRCPTWSKAGGAYTACFPFRSTSANQTRAVHHASEMEHAHRAHCRRFGCSDCCSCAGTEGLAQGRRLHVAAVEGWLRQSAGACRQP